MYSHLHLHVCVCEQFQSAHPRSTQLCNEGPCTSVFLNHCLDCFCRARPCSCLLLSFWCERLRSPVRFLVELAGLFCIRSPASRERERDRRASGVRSARWITQGSGKEDESLHVFLFISFAQSDSSQVVVGVICSRPPPHHCTPRFLKHTNPSKRVHPAQLDFLEDVVNPSSSRDTM